MHQKHYKQHLLKQITQEKFENEEYDSFQPVDKKDAKHFKKRGYNKQTMAPVTEYRPQ